jgi:hypothetical protein
MKISKKVALSVAALVFVATACFLSWSYGFRSGMLAGGITKEIAEVGVFSAQLEDQLMRFTLLHVWQMANKTTHNPAFHRIA